MILHYITTNSLRVDTSIAGYCYVGVRFCMAQLITLPGLIASGTSIVGYAGLLPGGYTVLPGIANSSPRVDCFRNQYRRVLLGGRTILHGITNNSLSVDCFRNQYRQAHRVNARWAYDFLPRLIVSGTSIAGYC